MGQEFSKNLIARLQRYFQEYHGLVVSDDQAVLFLDSLGGLFIAFESSLDTQRRRTRKRPRRRGTQYLT